MNYIDLHVHSNASDGTKTPKELVYLAASKGLTAFALTDHDTVKGIKEAKKAALELSSKEHPLQIIPGIELSASFKKKDIHILGLYIDETDPILLNTLEKILQERKERNEKMVRNLADAGIDITMEKLVSAEGDAVLTRAHFAKYLTEHHYTRTTKEAFVKYLDQDGPYYVPRRYLTPPEAIKLIKQAKGIPVLAHPLLYHLPEPELYSLVEELAGHGLGGLEAIYSSNEGYDEQQMRRLAKEKNLLITGGSDYHGLNKPTLDLGTGRGNLKIPSTLLEPLLEWKRREYGTDSID